MAVSTEKTGNSSGKLDVSACGNVSETDQQLIDDCLNGRSEAFGDLVLRYQDRLFNSLVRMVGCAEEAREVSQESFVHAFTKLSSFRGESAFYSWLFRIAYNAAVSRKRKQKQRVASLDAARENAGIEPHDHNPTTAPTYAMETTERQSQVQQALAELAEEFRVVLVLKEIDGLPYNEIAEIVGIPIGTVRSRIHRARSELREKLRVALQEEMR